MQEVVLGVLYSEQKGNLFQYFRFKRKMTKSKTLLHSSILRIQKRISSKHGNSTRLIKNIYAQWKIESTDKGR